LAGSEIAGKIEAADADADEAQRGVAGGGRHAADLAVSAFVKLEGDPGVGDILAEADGRIAGRPGGVRFENPGAGGKGAAALNFHSGGEAAEGLGGGPALDLNLVAPPVGIARIEEAVVQGALVTEEEKTLGVKIEPADRIHAGGKSEFRERPLAGMIRRELGEDSVGFVKGEKHAAAGAGGRCQYDVAA